MSASPMTEWQPIETAPKDGTWFMICNAADGFDSFEVGRYEPLLWDDYVDVGNGLYRKERKPVHEWRGFNNMHRATHWMPLPAPPARSSDDRVQDGDKGTGA